MAEREHYLRRALPPVLALAFLLAAFARGEEVVENYPGGGVKRRYSVDKDGKKHGGKLKRKAAYKKGLLDGRATEYDAKGRLSASQTFKKGLLDGEYRRYEKGRVVFRTTLVSHSRTVEEIKKTLGEIGRAEPKEKLTAARTKAWRMLRAYRYLADVPYKDLVFEESFTAFTDLAVEVMNANGVISHTPENPGWATAKYDKAYEGCKKSNLAWGRRLTVERAVQGWMDDSEPKNLPHVGHRRHCLSPFLKKTAFSIGGRAAAMWVHDRSRKKAADYDMTCFPARGYMPVSHFRQNAPWSVTLNPLKFGAIDKKRTTVRVYPLDGEFIRGEKMALNHFSIDTRNAGVANCIIFRPEKVSVAHGSRYWVEIGGLVGRVKGLAYVVEFVKLGK